MRIHACTVTKRPHMIERVIRSMALQARRPDSWVVATHGWEVPQEMVDLASSLGVEMTRMVAGEDMTLGAVRNAAFDVLACSAEPEDLLAAYDDDDYYAPDYFLDLEEIATEFSEGVIFGIRDYWIGWVKGSLDLDGGNIFGKWMSNGGKKLSGRRVTWVVDATTALRAKHWWSKVLRYGELPKGECEALQAAAAEHDLPVIGRDPDTFCVVRFVHEDGYGGDHAHTWGPLEYREPGAKEEAAPPPPPPRPKDEVAAKFASAARGILEGLASFAGKTDAEPELTIWVADDADKRLPSILRPVAVDKHLDGDVVEFRVGEHVVKRSVLPPRGA